MKESNQTYAQDTRKWCACQHPDNWHDETGQCHAFVGLEFEYDCDCSEFRETELPVYKHVEPSSQEFPF